jgi:hypothetical protein
MKVRDRILQTLRANEPRRLFRTMQLAGSNGPLFKLYDEGLIDTQERGGRGKYRWFFFVSDAQHAAIVPMPLSELVADALDGAIARSWLILDWSAEKIAYDLGRDAMFDNVDREALIFQITEWKTKQKVAA